MDHKRLEENYRKTLDRVNEYNKKTYTQVAIRLNTEADADIIDAIKSHPGGPVAYIRQLVRADLDAKAEQST